MPTVPVTPERLQTNMQEFFVAKNKSISQKQSSITLYIFKFFVPLYQSAIAKCNRNNSNDTHSVRLANLL